eukprot:g143.t1
MSKSPLDIEQVGRAVKSLLKYVNGRKGKDGSKQLIEEADYVLLSVGLTKIPEKGRNKPFRIKISHPIYDSESMDLCMFVKDSKEIKKRLAEHPVPCVKKVLSLQKLRTDYKDFEAKRKLCAGYDMFLCQDSILPMMPKAIGKKFFVKKKQPIPIKCTSIDLGVPVRRALESTYLYLGWGSCSTVRVGLTAMTSDQIVENIVTAMEGITGRVPKKWRGIRSLHIKTGNSVALPIYSARPEAEADSESVRNAQGKRKKETANASELKKKTKKQRS